jgi:hypothetical protein
MWCFEGDNCAATHLIRNALSADKKKRAELLSITGKVRRWFRDDITVTLVMDGGAKPLYLTCCFLGFCSLTTSR